MFTKILLATDGSSRAKGALNYARDLASRDQAQIIVVYAFPPVPDYLGDPWREQFISGHVSEGERIANQAADELRVADLDVIVEVLEGPPADAILRVTDVHQCDLIVMGNRGHGELTSLLLGSVSHRVLAHAHIPVLIVKNLERTDHGQSLAETEGRSD
jgi:nucleotide-binding universal stress UspA family protein